METKYSAGDTDVNATNQGSGECHHPPLAVELAHQVSLEPSRRGEGLSRSTALPQAHTPSFPPGARLVP